MNKTFFMVILIVVLLTACGGLDPIALLKANSQVQSFLEQYPNADITLVKLSSDQISAENIIAKGVCGIELPAEPHYKVRMVDPDSDLEIYAYIHIESQEIVCVRKIGKEEIKKHEMNQPEEELQEQETEQHKEQEKETEQNKKEEKTEQLEHCDTEIELEYELKDDKVLLTWTPYECEDFQYYKVVWSSEVEHPKYPDNGYIEVITDSSENLADPKLKNGVNYYGISVVTKNGNIHSNPVEIEYEGEESECDDYDPLLEYALTEGELVLEWNPYTCSDLNYYKVVWSQENDDPMYPEDSYIQVISDYANTRFVVPDEKFKEGTNYYRISVILDGFYDGNDDKRINTNVVEIEN